MFTYIDELAHLERHKDLLREAEKERIELLSKTLSQVWHTLATNWYFLLASAVIAAALKLYVDQERVAAFLQRNRFIAQRIPALGLGQQSTGQARNKMHTPTEIAFCFLDAEKEVCREIYEMVVPRMTKGGLLVADNAINHREALQPMLTRALGDDRVDALIVPIGKGELVCRKARRTSRRNEGRAH